VALTVARAIADLESRIDRHAVAAQFDRATDLAREVLLLRRRSQGDRHWQTVDAQMQVEHWDRLARMPRQARAALGQAYEQLSQAEQLSRRGRLAEAERAARQALLLCRDRLGDEDVLTARAFNRVGFLLSTQGRFNEAQVFLQKTLAVERKLRGDDYPSTAAACRNLAVLLRRQGKYREARPLYEKALAVRRKLLGEEHPDTVRSLNDLADLYRALGDYRAALALAQSAVKASREGLGVRHPDHAASLNNLAVLYRDRSDFRSSLPLFRHALEINRTVLGEKHLSTATSYDNLAGTFQAQGMSREAQLLYEKALAIRRERLGEQHLLTVSSYDKVAASLDAQGKHAQAQPLLEKALAFRRKLLGEEHPDTASSYVNLATNLNAQSKYAEAQPLYEKALAARRKVLGEQHPYTAGSYNNVAYNLNAQGQYALAEPLYERALAIWSKAVGEQHPSTATTCNNLATTLQFQSKYAEAQPLYEKALAIWRKVLGEQHPDTAAGYDGVAGNLNAQARYAEAQHFYQRALDVRRQALGEDHPRTAESYNNLAVNLWRQGQLSQALLLLQASLPGQETARFNATRAGLDRSGARQPRFFAREALAVGLARLGQPGNAFRHAEAGLPHGLLDELTAPESKDRTTVEALHSRLRRLDQQLVPLLGLGDLPADRRDLRDELVSQRRDFLSRLARLAAEAADRQVLPLSRIAPHIPPDAALVFWLDVDAVDEHWACVVRREGAPAWQRLSGSGKGGTWTSDDRQLAQRLSRLLARPGGASTTLDRASAALRQQRLDPVLPHLGAAGRLPVVRRLLVVPTGAMASIPLDVLTDRYLVSYVPSGTVLARLKERSRPLSGSPALALGDPVFTSGDGPPGAFARFPRLPGTRREVEMLRKLVADCSPLLGSAASEQALDQLAWSGKLKQFRLIHLATHGVGDPRRPERSALILARDRVPDPVRQMTQGRKVYTGELTVQTVQREWNLDADLVVLSTCASGQGAEPSTDGIPPFARAFLQAGARRVIVPRWDVDDAATLLLIDRFYDRLLGASRDRHAGPAQALDEARRWLRGLSRKEVQQRMARVATGVQRGVVVRRPRPLPAGERPFAHPYYWAGFALIGDPE
jgi:CHAT domain-containing protein/tetratricopeptide (TPR) repeat protein